MIELLRSPWLASFERLARSVRLSLVISSPFISARACGRLGQILSKRDGIDLPELFILTDLSTENLLTGATDAAALEGLVDSIPQSAIRFLPSLHAKVYVADTSVAVISSANFTENGLLRNFEYGVALTDRPLVKQVRADVLAYGALGSPIGRAQLRAFASAAAELRGIRARAEASLRRTLRIEFEKKLNEVEDTVVRARVAGRSPYSIFAEAIEYLLSRGPMRTTEMHAAIQRIHPDLCDDNVDRVIDGRHYGKKWKHAVRTAQSHLKERGIIELRDGAWMLSHARASG